MSAVLLALLGVLAACAPALAADRPELAPRIGDRIDPGLPLVDSGSRRLTFATLAAGRPALLLLGYHRCPNLCGVAQRGLLEALQATGLPSAAYAVIFASIDPTETAADARDARQALRDAAPAADLSAWHFVTGDPPQVSALEAFLGLSADRRPNTALYVHPVAVATVTPDGRLARVFPGLDYAPRDLRLALVEASEGRLGGLGDRILLLCSGFDPTTGRYTGTILAGVRIGGLLALAGLAAALVNLGRRGRRPA